MTVNNTKYVLETALVFKDDTLYVPIDAAVKGLGYTCNWDINTNVATIINNNPESSILPYRYSYVDKQKNTGKSWDMLGNSGTYCTGDISDARRKLLFFGGSYVFE